MTDLPARLRGYRAHDATADALMDEAAAMIEELLAALMPFANQNYSDVAALLQARRLCGLPDFPPLDQAMAEMREKYGHYFDGVDPTALREEG